MSSLEIAQCRISTQVWFLFFLLNKFIYYSKVPYFYCFTEERPTFDGWSCRLGFMLLTFNLLVITGIATGISNMIRICVDPPECKTGEVYVIIALVIIFLGFIGFLIGRQCCSDACLR